MERQLNITGQSKIAATPDIIILSLNINAHEWEYEKSLKALDERVQEVREIIQKHGIKKEELKTKDFNIEKQTSYNKKKDKSEFNGFYATHRMELKLPLKKELINKLITSIAQNAEDLEFDISFGVKNTKKYEKQLIKNAITNAKEIAKVICDNSGTQLKEIINIDYSFKEIYIRSHYSSMRSEYMVAEATMSPDLEPDDINISDSINITWRIE